MNTDKLSGYASIGGFIFTIASFFTKDTSIHILLLALTSLIFIFLCCYSFKRYSNASCYLDGEKEIRELHNNIILEKSKIKTKAFEGIIFDLSNICTQISEAFGKIKGEQIGVCIKYTNGDISNPYVKTLCRDSHSNNTRRDFDNSNELDYMFKNTDFEHIFKQLKQHNSFKNMFYCENRLANKHQYNNSHLRDVELPSGFLSYYIRRKKWPLPYKSTIVVPFLSPNSAYIAGFLCIDSPRSNGFCKEKDVVILQQIALFMQELINFVCVTHLKK